MFVVSMTANMSEGGRVGLISRILENQLFRSFLIFSIFRAIYGAGIVIITYFLATSDETPAQPWRREEMGAGYWRQMRYGGLAPPPFSLGI